MRAVILGIFILTSAILVMKRRNKATFKTNVVLSGIFYVAGLNEILFCDIVFPVVLMYAYLMSIIANLFVSCPNR